MERELEIHFNKPPIPPPDQKISGKGKDTIRGTGGKTPPIIKKG